MKYIGFILTAIFILSGCSAEEKIASKDSIPGMKCGAGKCGANMFDGNAALAKKKKNILFQMRESDPRKDCVIKAKTTKEAYECVRHPKTSKLTMKCGSEMKVAEKNISMKCGTGKCGNSMK